MKTKICPRCRIEKNITEFYKDRSRKDGHMCYCKQCIKEYTITLNVNRKKINAVYHQKIIQKIHEYKIRKGCEICGYNKHFSALVFHHKNPKEKEFSINQMQRSFGWQKIKKEIAKCQVLCANCHSILHWK